jgi:hypothetical protein
MQAKFFENCRAMFVSQRCGFSMSFLKRLEEPQGYKTSPALQDLAKEGEGP